MADSKVSALDTLASVDRATDLLYIVDASGPTSNKITVNSALGISGGDPVSTSDTQTLTNKTITTPTLTVRDNALTIQDNADPTKQLLLQLSSISTGTTRTLTVPDASTTLVGTDTTQTLTNKTLTSPTLNTATIVNPTITADSINEYTSANGVNIDGLNIKDGAVGANGVVTASITAGAVTPEKLQSGAGTGWAWTSYTPTWTNLSVGNGTLVAKYKQTGKTVNVHIGLTFGATTSITGSPSFTLPVTTVSATYVASASNIGTASYIDTGTAGYIGSSLFLTTTTASLVVGNAGGTYVGTTALSSTVPFTWGSTDYIGINLVYEAA